MLTAVLSEFYEDLGIDASISTDFSVALWLRNSHLRPLLTGVKPMNQGRAGDNASWKTVFLRQLR